jgi:hypothetical protein
VPETHALHDTPVGGKQQTLPAVARTVLAVGTDDWAIEQSAAALEVAGHTVHRCHEPGAETFPCNAFRPGHGCPLDAGVDVVVTSRARPMDIPAGGETGVTCGLRAGLPLIVSGISRHSPFTSLAERLVGEQGDLVEAVEMVAAEHDRAHRPTAPAPRSNS